ncbi:hypothetical protein BDD12DRAFT_802574 [Trichophaea hybrida]|nr:hypothetical protein BDD12DRAFT_802574 [Trichophaea hybrida]
MVDRGSKLRVQADLIDVFHGTLTTGGTAGTLIIAEFRFLNMSSDKSRRFRHGEIMMTFADKQGRSGFDPEVLDIAPLGTFSFNSTESCAEVTNSANFSTNFGMNGASLGADIRRDSTETTKRTHKTTLIGAIIYEGKVWGEKNAAVWTMDENSSREDGIPNLIQTAILLKRKSNDPFVLTVKIDAEVNFIYDTNHSIRKLFGRIKEDDPITFDPEVQWETTRTGVHLDDLSVVTLEELTRICSPGPDN